MSNRVYSGTTISGLQQGLADHVAPYRLRTLSADPFRGELVVTRSGDVSVAVMALGVPVQAEVGAMPDNAYHITFSDGGGLAVRVDGGPAEIGPYVLCPGQQVRARWPAGRRIVVVRLARRLVERAWRDQGGRTMSAPLRFAVPLSPVAKRSHVWESLASAFVAARDSGVLSASASTNARFGLLLAQTLLNLQQYDRPRLAPDSLAGSAPERAGTGTDNDVPPVPAPVRRAMEFCRAHAREPLVVADIADIAGVSVRRLQAAFRTHVGMSPIEYVRQLRLDGVHQDLKRIAEGTTKETVTDAALRWGFTHLGRFSGTYRAEFGMLPSQTARSEPPTQG
ncbi:AraC family transcriptional regulator [Streptodolium elevatio]|uniref:AraC family transcriptional regulator n=1 Tax=Streptodolium elevatio TaxID=3157996 RepID=A0ABV3D9Q4_9ACTN